MCQIHASVIDDPNTSQAYEPSLLHNWKAAQREEHERFRQGWPLTNAMAKESLSVSFSNVGLALNNSTVTLIGEGGRSPGAGGGGGPAIGPNARGGRGGRGGNLIDLDGNLISTDLSALANDLEGPPPGAGGGGPASGDGAIGGNGGDGGEGVLGTIAVEPGDILEVSVGEGGRAATLPGEHGHPAGDAVITIKSSDGVVKRVVRARGGAGGKSGELPDDWVTISENDLHNGFQISPPITANSVELRDGLLFMLGGGWSKWVAPSLPMNVVWLITCVASWRELHPEIAHGLQLSLSDADGNEVSRVAFSLTANDPNIRSCIWTLPIGAALDREGLWHLRVHSGQFILSEASVLVQVHRE